MLKATLFLLFFFFTLFNHANELNQFQQAEIEKAINLALNDIETFFLQ